MKNVILTILILSCIVLYGLMLHQHDVGMDKAIQNETVDTFNRGRGIFD